MFNPMITSTSSHCRKNHGEQENRHRISGYDHHSTYAGDHHLFTVKKIKFKHD
jgi:hypothetical protein